MCSKAFDRTKNEKCMDKRSLFSRDRAHYFIKAFTGKSLAIAADECLTGNIVVVDGPGRG